MMPDEQNGSHRVAGLALAFWAFHFVWEMAQAQFFATMKGLPMWKATRWCAGAAGWDVAITMAAFAVGALATLDLRWPLRQHVHRGAVAAYLATGLAVTVAIERWALRVGHWRYTDSMPLVVGIGLTPLLQWIVIPLLVLGVVRRGRARPSP